MTTQASQIITRIVGFPERPIVGTLASEDGNLAASIPTGSTVTLFGTRIDDGTVAFSGRDVTITDWATLVFSCQLVTADVARTGDIRLRFEALPVGGTAPDDVIPIPDNDKKYLLVLRVTAF